MEIGKIEKALEELRNLQESYFVYEKTIREKLERGIREFAENIEKERKEIAYIGKNGQRIVVDLSKVLAKHLREKFESAKEKYGNDICSLLSEILPTVVTCHLSIYGIREHNVEFLQSISPLGEKAKYVKLKTLLDSFHHGNSNIVREYGVEIETT